jgi:hypothetical protein
MELNPQILAFLSVFAVILLVMFGTPYLFPHSTDLPKNISNQSNVTIIYKTVTKLVTPTPDGHTYFASEYQNGTRLLQRPFSWIRYNALGTSDMKVTTIVYDYKMFDKLHIFQPTDYKYDEVLPDEGKKYLLIFVYVFMDDIIGDDTRMWAFNRNFFAVYDGNETFIQKEYPYQLRFRELEETFTFDNSYRVEAFKSFRSYSHSSAYSENAGEYNNEIYYLRGGKSNAIDGFLLYEIPEKDTPEDLTVLAKFYAFGWSNWMLRA